MPDKPNPGSKEAVLEGCQCPIMDNRYGAGVPIEDGPLYWISVKCPLHGVREEKKGNELRTFEDKESP